MLLSKNGVHWAVFLISNHPKTLFYSVQRLLQMNHIPRPKINAVLVGISRLASHHALQLREGLFEKRQCLDAIMLISSTILHDENSWLMRFYAVDWPYIQNEVIAPTTLHTLRRALLNKAGSNQVHIFFWAEIMIDFMYEFIVCAWKRVECLREVSQKIQYSS